MPFSVVDNLENISGQNKDPSFYEAWGMWEVAFDHFKIQVSSLR